MNNIRALIGQVKSELQEIQNQLNPWLNEADKTEKQNQLKAVAGSLDKLTKTEVTIPTELRDLKLKLHRDLDQFKEAKIVKAELDEMLSQFEIQKKSIRKRTPKKVLIKKIRKSTGNRIELLNLIQNGIIEPKTKLVKRYKGTLYEATITNEGQIELLYNGIMVSHNTPSAAAEYLSRAKQNGWTWWSLEGDTKGRTLDYYRQKYIQNGKETGR